MNSAASPGANAQSPRRPINVYRAAADRNESMSESDASYYSSEDWENAGEEERPHCGGRLTKRQFIIAIISCIVLGLLVALLVAYAVANMIVQSSIVEPTNISMNAAGYDLVGGRRLQSLDQLQEFVKLTVSAAVTNTALMGGVLKSTRMDCYIKTKNTNNEPKDLLAVSFTIPDTEVESQIEGAKVQICKQDEDWDNGVCALRDLTSKDLENLHRMVQLILEADFIDMKMVAPEGVKLRAMGMTLPFSFTFEKEFKARGMGGALNAVRIENFKISGRGDDLDFVSDAVITNPSIFGFTLIPAQLQLYLMRNESNPAMKDCPQYIYLGDASCDESVYLAPGTSTRLELKGGMYRGAKTECVNSFLERYLNGKPNQVIAKIGNTATKSKYLNAILGGTDMTATMQEGLKCRGSSSGCELVTHVDNTGVVFNDVGDLFTGLLLQGKPFNLIKQVRVNMTIFNPFPKTKLRTTAHDLQIVYKGMELGKIVKGPKNLIVDGGSEGVVPLVVEGLNAKQNDLKRQLDLACDLLVDECYVDAGPKTNFAAQVGAYNFKIGYQQKRIKITCNMDNFLQQACETVLQTTTLLNQVKRLCKNFNPAMTPQYLKKVRRKYTPPQQLPKTRKKKRKTKKNKRRAIPEENS